MSERIHVLAQQLFGKSSVAECDVEEIKQLTQRYPYFAPAQFLLLEKLKQENSPDYHSQLQKAVLYYHNPLEFEYFISSERFYTDEQAARYTVHVTPEETANEETPVLDGQEVELDRNASYASEELNFIANEREENEQEEKKDGEFYGTGMDAAKGELEQLEISSFHNETIEEPEDLETLHAPIVEFSDESETTVYDEKDQDNGPNISVQLSAELSSYSIPKPPTPDSQLQTPNPEPLAFEPYHTVDYFASQGIKLSQDEVPKDKFGKQLKSFTEWLKTMKRLPVTEIPQAANSSLESNVQHLAEDSVHESEIVTEAMAEVWLKQGNRQKALEIYNKLGLLNPSKRAYFAALIENVKRS